MASLQPVEILRPGADEEKAETARLSSFVGAIAIGDLVKSTLGPRGMDKLLVSSGKHNAGEVHITNDGATILKAIGVDNPAAKVLVDLAKTQDDEVGDGTTSVTVLAAELLREAEKLMALKLHPQTIIAGWRKAKQAALECLEKSAVDHTGDIEKFTSELLNIARTTLSSKILHQHRDHFAKLAVDAILRLHRASVAAGTVPVVQTGTTAKLDTAGAHVNLEAIQILKRLGGNMRDSYLEEGFLLDKRIATNSQHRVEKARVLIANTPMDSDKIKVFGSRIRVDSVAKVAELEEAEREKMKAKVAKIVESGCNVFINRQLIYNYPEQLLSEKGVCVIEHADFEGVERLAYVLGGDIVSTFDEATSVRLGECAVVEEVLIGEDKLVRFGGVKRGEACTIVLRGATKQILDEAERSLHDALCVLQRGVGERRAVLGGGASEMRMANAVRRAAEREAGKQSEAILAFARALEALPSAIADNAGLDAAELVSELRAAHAEGGAKANWGLLINDGIAGDVRAAGVIEALAVKRAVVQSAAEAAELIMRVDSIIKQAPRPRKRDMRPH